MGKRIEAVHGEIQLHEAIIQHIQWFLNCKEAAQTSILSKSWYTAWATRPILDLDQRNFQNRGGADSEPLITNGFSEFSKKIMLRYEESNLKIENFRLCMENTETDSFLLANELIVNALKLGAFDLTVEFLSQTPEFVLPHEVLGSKNLVRLSASGCRIDHDATDGTIDLSKLKFLRLHRVCILGSSAWGIISSCPLLEELVLSECTCICRFRISNGATVDVTRTLALRSLIEFGKQNVGLVVGSPINQYDNLKCLFLEKIKIDELLFHDMSIKFPCLKDLTMNHCSGFIELNISLPSLEFLSIAQVTVLSATFDVPNLRKFTFSGRSLPFLSFKAASREWESYISVKYLQNHISSSWLVKLKNFLMGLSASKISLTLCFRMLFGEEFDDIGRSRGLPAPVVENLMISMLGPTSVCFSLLKRIFWSCRPKFVTHNWLPELSIGREVNSDTLKLLCKTLIEEESENCCIPSRHMSDMYDLKKVDIEIFEDSLAEWQSLCWKAWVDASTSSENKQKVRFKLRWGLDPSAL